MNPFAKQSENIIKAFALHQSRAIRLKMLAEQFNQVKHLLSDEQKKETIERFRGLGLENPERFISDSPETTHKTFEEINSELRLEATKKEIEYYEEAINSFKTSGKEKLRYFLYGTGVTLIVTAIGIVPNIIEQFQKQHQEKYIVLPKIQIVCDTSGIASPDTIKVSVISAPK